MADTKISNLPSASALAGTEPLPIVQDGATKQTTVQDIANLAGGNQTLNDVLVEGNQTLGTNIKVNNADAIELENAALLKKGTYDFTGLAELSAVGGISRFCSVAFEDNWQKGINHIFDDNGLIRQSNFCKSIIPDGNFDNTQRFKVGSRWVLDDGTVYVCSDASTGTAVWIVDPNTILFENISQSDFSDLVTANKLVVGKWYYIYTAFNHPIMLYLDIICQAISSNEININNAIAIGNGCTGVMIQTSAANINSVGTLYNGTLTLTNSQISAIEFSSNPMLTKGMQVLIGTNNNIVSQITTPIVAFPTIFKVQLENVFDTITSKFGTYNPATSTFTANASAGTGDVTGAASSTDNNIAVFDGTTGKIIKDGGKKISELVLANTAITGATKTKITYDSKGLVTSGADATTADIAASTNKNYVTDAQLTVIGNTSGTNSGNETTSTLGVTINGATAATPNDTDLVATVDTSVVKKITWTNVKAFLKTYFDGIYQAILTAANLHTFVDSLTSLTTPVDADRMIIVDNSASLAKKITWANIKATLKTYFDGLYLTGNTAITGATKTKITYDTKGLVTSGADATTADIADSTNKRYVTDANLTTIGNQSGTNTGDETTSTIKTKLGITTLSGSNTGDQDISTLMVKANNLSDLTNTTTARTNLKILDVYITTGDQTTTAVTASSITGLSWSGVANKRYKVSGIIHVGCSGVGGVKIQLTLPTGATMFIYGVGITNTGGTTLIQIAHTTSATLSAAAFCPVVSTVGYIKIDGEIQLSSTAGTVQLGFASGTATQTSTIFQLGSQITITEI